MPPIEWGPALNVLIALFFFGAILWLGGLQTAACIITGLIAAPRANIQNRTGALVGLGVGIAMAGINVGGLALDYDLNSKNGALSIGLIPVITLAAGPFVTWWICRNAFPDGQGTIVARLRQRRPHNRRQ